MVLEDVSLRRVARPPDRPPPEATTAATGVGQTETTAVSHLPGAVGLVAQRIRSDVGVSQVVKLRLDPSAAQV
jgi:hypothetical protein